MRGHILHDFRALEVYAMKFAAIGATALLEYDNQAFSFVRRILQIGPHFQKAVQKERLVVQTVIAQDQLGKSRISRDTCQR